jgi:hypothetical protein
MRWSAMVCFAATNVAQATAPVAPSTSEKTRVIGFRLVSFFWHRGLDDANPFTLIKRLKSQSGLPPETWASWRNQLLNTTFTPQKRSLDLWN